MAALIFIPAGTLYYWQGWLFLFTFSAATTGFTVYLALYDKPLLERRLAAGPGSEKEWSQKIIISLMIMSFLAFIIFPVVDHKIGYSPVPAWLSAVGDLIVFASFMGVFAVLRFNSFAASNVRVEEGQRLIETGPYAWVRHPMYASALWMFVGIPLALGSWWAIALNIICFPILLWRLLDEERVLRRDLPGYIEYAKRVRYRLFPYLW
jgi:protein-S-isoprenylcysteine O-methyltransferase Ste14